MKKILTGLVMALCVAGAAFAFDNDIDVNFSLPMNYKKTESSVTVLGVTTTTTNKAFENGFGFDICDTAMFTNTFGIKVNAGFWWPSKQKSTTIVSVGSTVTSSETTLDFTDVFVFNGFAGVALNLYNTKSFTFLVVPGVNFYVRNYSNHTTFDFGIGGDFVGKFMVTHDLYATLSCPVIWNLAEKIDDTNIDDFKGYIAFTPKIGLGYRF